MMRCVIRQYGAGGLSGNGAPLFRIHTSESQRPLDSRLRGDEREWVLENLLSAVYG